MGHFGPGKMAHSHISGSIKVFFFEILHHERGQQVYGTYINGFHLRQMRHFVMKMTRHHNSGSTPRSCFEVLHNDSGQERGT